MTEVFLGIFSVCMITCYITSAIYSGLNIWFNYAVINKNFLKAFAFYFISTILMIFCGTDWIVNEDYLKVPVWKAISWGIIHICMSLGYLTINNELCEVASTIKCDVIKAKIENILQNYISLKDKNIINV
jgi:hypothetical protein